MIIVIRMLNKVFIMYLEKNNQESWSSHFTCDNLNCDPGH